MRKSPGVQKHLPGFLDRDGENDGISEKITGRGYGRAGSPGIPDHRGKDRPLRESLGEPGLKGKGRPGTGPQRPDLPGAGGREKKERGSRQDTGERNQG